MAYDDRQTSLITILSTEHGRLRREQRDIDKRDLQKALKFGKKESNYKGRWKIEYDGIVFIADPTCSIEITAYPAPLALAPVTTDAHMNDDKAKQLLERKPDLCASHTVLVVDNSGSMTTHDIILHRDRQVAAYSTTAIELVAEQLFNGTANNSDVVSLVEFSDTARVIFTREPVSWPLYNKLLSRRDIQRTFHQRENSKIRELYKADSNYLPALDAAEKLLAEGTHENCALSLFFLSDGAPSDARNLGITTTAALGRLRTKVAQIATRFSDQEINICLVGFGNHLGDFSDLQEMAQAANDSTGRPSTATFMYCDKMASAVGTAVTSLVTSLTATRTVLMDRAAGKGSSRMKRSIESEDMTQVSHDWRYFRIVNHLVYDPSIDDWLHLTGLPAGSLRKDNMNEAARRQSNPPPFLALNTKSCGTGVERVAFRCYISDGHRPTDFKFGAMVAKETNLVERIEENVEYHKTFCETQDLASHLAVEFNSGSKPFPATAVGQLQGSSFWNVPSSCWKIMLGPVGFEGYWSRSSWTQNVMVGASGTTMPEQ
jgi:Mg-chelatase subunit ChlD